MTSTGAARGPIPSDTVSDADLAFAIELADVVASITSAAFGGRLDIELKADHSPVTDADLAVEQALRDAVARVFPDDDVLGEEEGRLGPGRGDRAWVVDPIDGTKNFADGVPLWTTMIALTVARRSPHPASRTRSGRTTSDGRC